MLSQEVVAAAAAKLRRIPAVVEAERPLALDLDAAERHQVIQTFITLVEGLYAHLPQKRAMYGHDPVQRLRLLEQRVGAIEEKAFHRTVAEILTDLRDAHTRYIGPGSEQRRVAVLPFLVEAYDDRHGITHFIVSKIFAGAPGHAEAFASSRFEEGVEITHWNGIPMARAVDLYAERETGGRPDARQARALDSLTIRPLRYGLPPDEEWLIISFTRLDGDPGEVRVEWFVAEELEDEPEAAELDGSARRAYAGNPAAEASRRAKKLLFATDKWHAAASDRLASVSASVAEHKEKGEWFTGAFQDNVAARVVTTRFGQFGHLRLWSFDLRDDDGFIDEVVQLVDELPRHGLIIDLRGNPGGLIWAAERMLQLFTPDRIEPTRFSIYATDLTRAMAAAPQGGRELARWSPSLKAAVTNGEFYSRGVPLTPVQLCNDRGQHYPGPVVAIVDANTYSAGDLFAAGFVDNRLGTLVSVGQGTGGGGANVWYQDHVRRALAGTPYAVGELPRRIGYTIAFRRAVRVGDVAGTTIEDLGIAGHERRSLTKTDLTNGNADLLDYCGGLLASEILTDLELTAEGSTLRVRTAGLDRIDVFVDGRPLGSRGVDRSRDGQDTAIDLPAGWRSFEVVGLAGDIVRQRRRLGP